jgi:hypothetical protein
MQTHSSRPRYLRQFILLARYLGCWNRHAPETLGGGMTLIGIQNGSGKIIALVFMPNSYLGIWERIYILLQLGLQLTRYLLTGGRSTPPGR